MPKYHFYIWREGQPGRLRDQAFDHDEAAMAHARTLLKDAEAVEVLRGALVLGKVGSPQVPDDSETPPRRRWWFTASPAPRWIRDKR